MKKNSNVDFKMSDLPKNRKELFFDIFKNQTRALIFLAMVAFLIVLPFILVRYYNLLSIDGIIESNLQDSEKQSRIQEMTLYTSLICLVLCILASIFSAGIFRIIKQLSFNEGFLFGPSFLKGIKENIKDFSVTFLIIGLVNLLVEMVTIRFAFSNSLIYYLLKAIFVLIIIPIILTSLVVCSIYSDKLIKKIFVSVTIFFKYLHLILLAYLIVVAPLLVMIIPNTFIQLFYPMIYAMLYLPFAIIIFYLFVNHCLDKLINQKSFPELYQKGLFH